jgi:hypothetical protein
MCEFKGMDRMKEGNARQGEEELGRVVDDSLPESSNGALVQNGPVDFNQALKKHLFLGTCVHQRRSFSEYRFDSSFVSAKKDGHGELSWRGHKSADIKKEQKAKGGKIMYTLVAVPLPFRVSLLVIHGATKQRRGLEAVVSPGMY